MHHPVLVVVVGAALALVLIIALVSHGISVKRRREQQAEELRRYDHERSLDILASQDPRNWQPISSSPATSPNCTTFELMMPSHRGGGGSVYRLEQGGKLFHCFRYPELGSDRWQDLPDFDDEPRLDAIYERLVAFYDPKLFGETS